MWNSYLRSSAGHGDDVEHRSSRAALSEFVVDGACVEVGMPVDVYFADDFRDPDYEWHMVRGEWHMVRGGAPTSGAW